MTTIANEMAGKRTNIWLSKESETAIQAIYDHLAKQKVFYDYKGQPNTSAIIEYALRRVKLEIEDDAQQPAPASGDTPAR